MSLLSITKVSLYFSGKPVFKEIGFQVESRDRIGLVGPNGSGKTSLLRLMTGENIPDSGDVHIAKEIRIGYLPQDIQDTWSGKLLKTIVDSAPGRIRLRRQLSKLESALKKATTEQDQTHVAEKLAEIYHEKEQVEVTFPRHEAEKILLGLGFVEADFVKPLSSFSGGWKMRAALAGLLFQKPDLLLLDEPTNHLDIPSIHWLESFLLDFSGAMILVSHDKDFLNRQILRTVSFEPEGMRSCVGNYDAYLKVREEEEKNLAANARKQEQRVKDAEKFIERFRSKASKARQAQSKLKLIQKIDLVKTHRKEKVTRFVFPDVPRSGRIVTTLTNISKYFDSNVLYESLNLSVQRGERIAIIGPNGSGKTTLLKLVAGELQPDKGEITLGHGINIAYFAQHHSEMLDPHKTVIQEVYSEVPDRTIGFVRGVCGAFLFSGDDVEKPVGVLSGGERARVSLAKILVKPGNLMVMDEPTNHLDLSSSEALIKALSDYNGTLMFVSHNQSFVNRLATKIWDVRDKKIVEYPGNLKEYYSCVYGDIQAVDSEPNAPRDENGDDGQSGANRRDRKHAKKERAEKRQMVYNTLKPIRSDLEQLEKRIEAIEMRQKTLEKSLADPDFFSDQEKSVPLLGEYKKGRQELEVLLLKWEKMQERLNAAKKELGVDDA